MPRALVPHITAAENFLGGLNVVAMPLLCGETPEEIQETAQFYGYEDWGQGPDRRFIGRRPYNPEPGAYFSIATFWAPQDSRCRIRIEHTAGEEAQIAAAAARWREMAANFPDSWELRLDPSRPGGAEGRAVAEAWLRRL